MHKTQNSKTTKKITKMKNNRNREFNGFNTGTRTMKSSKDYKRITPTDIRQIYREDMER